MSSFVSAIGGKWQPHLAEQLRGICYDYLPTLQMGLHLSNVTKCVWCSLANACESTAANKRPDFFLSLESNYSIILVLLLKAESHLTTYFYGLVTAKR